MEKWNPKKYLKNSLKKWKNFAMIITGMSRSGKSYMLKHILQQIPKFDFVIICSKTLGNQFYDFLDTKLKFDHIPDEVIERLKETFYKSDIKFNTLVIIDDMLSKTFKYEDAVTDLFLSGRHWNCSVAVLAQKTSMLSTSWMCNVTVVICLFSGSLREKKYISENLLANVLNATARDVNLKEEEKKAINMLTDICQNYNSIVILPMDNLVYTYRAGDRT